MENYNDQSAAYDFYGDVSVPVKKTFSRFALSLLAYSLVAYAVIFLAELIIILALGADDAQKLFENVYAQWIFNTIPTYGVALPVLYLIVRRMPTKRLKRSSIGIGEFILLFLVAQALMIAGSLVGNTLNAIIGAILNKDIANATSDLITASPVWLITLVAVIIGPIVEEFIFRKLLIDRLSRYGNVVAIITSAIAFGLFHGNFYQFFYAAMLGALLAYLYVRTGNWLYPVIMHMLVNLFGSVLALPVIEASEAITVLQEQLMEGLEIDLMAYYRNIAIVASHGLVTYGMAIGGAVILVQAIRQRRIHVDSDCEVYVPKRTCTAAALLNVGVILYLIFALIIFAISIFL